MSLRVPRILKMFVSLVFVALFTFVVYNSFESGDNFRGIIFSAAIIVSAYVLIKDIVVAIKGNSLLNKEVVMDQFIIGRIKTSLSLSYLYLIVHLSISLYSSDSLAAFKDSATLALFISFLVFMLIQIFQAFIYHSRE
ncbi:MULTISPECIES: hypothetical protein [unclassified Cytobacillus]|uniref:hypothetical protein n=1 Tax=unclassified Cytobacillus TaxID=2675268 RepID=UPI00135A6741|nr:hypothetical protein [Cytobacillus sp. AMY 15.2]KAF0817701.1 hypothetical protein KIS4809_3519 [Bacillus sp. ZZV12-4809]MCM3093739.1 hypothetical protein [Cytobacillus sp. AMY 15.2]